MAYTNYYQAGEKMARFEPFDGNTMFARIFDDTYNVFSYGTRIITIRIPSSNQEDLDILYFDDSRWSATTSKHQGCIRRAYKLERGSINCSR
jgi:hypothetical protein